MRNRITLTVAILALLVGAASIFMQISDQGRGERPAEPVARAPSAPDPQSASQGWITEIAVSRDGHFYLDGMVGSTRIRFLVDTGATRVALSSRDARRAGIKVNDAEFKYLIQTAAGIKRAAKFDISSIRIDDNWIYDIPSTIVEGDGGMSVLGMSFMRKLDRYEISSNYLTLYW